MCSCTGPARFQFFPSCCHTIIAALVQANMLPALLSILSQLLSRTARSRAPLGWTTFNSFPVAVRAWATAIDPLRGGLYFQFFPRCCGEGGAPRQVEGEVDFQFFPSCCAGANPAGSAAGLAFNSFPVAVQAGEGAGHLSAA